MRINGDSKNYSMEPGKPALNYNSVKLNQLLDYKGVWGPEAGGCGDCETLEV